MRRILLLFAGALALALAVPAAASAHHGRHHGRHHHHSARAHHARLEHFGGHASADPAAGGPADAGRIASFADGSLTITLADGSAITGKVTSDTTINCMAVGPTAAASDDDQGDDPGDQSGDDHGDQGDQGDQGDDDGGDHGQAACGMADLVAGTPVHEAILRIGAGGAEFKLVLLDKAGA